MKIEIILSDDINEIGTGMTCFEAPKYIADYISACRLIQGIVTIDGKAIKFSYSPYFHDGDVFTDDHELKALIIHLVPMYVYINRNKLLKHVPSSDIVH